jgi:hypothetical protein
LPFLLFVASIVYVVLFPRSIYLTHTCSYGGGVDMTKDETSGKEARLGRARRRADEDETNKADD